MGDTILSVNNISKSFGGVQALNDVSLDVIRGEIVGIIGPNGSGKTTLVNIISGFMKPDRGKVFFEGRDITKLPPYSRVKLGIIRTFQIPRPIGEFTVLENVVMAAMVAGVSEDLAFKRAEEVLTRIGLLSHANIKASDLNEIEKKRLELARALVVRPKLMLLDETMAGARGDELSSLLKTIRGLKEEGVTVIVVEHIVSAVSAISDRIIVLNQGKKIAEGRPKEVLENQEVKRAYLGES